MSSLKSLVNAANIALGENDHIKANALLRSALPLVGAAAPDFYLALLEINIELRDWMSVRLYARKVVKSALPPENRVFAGAYLCFATDVLKGRRAALRLYKVLKPYATTAVDQDSRKDEELGLAFAASVCDAKSAEKLFQSRHKYSDVIPITISPVLSSDEWCERNAVPMNWVERPKRISSENVPALNRHWDYNTDGHSVTSIHDAQVLPGWGYVRTPSGEILETRDFRYMLTLANKIFPHSLILKMRRVVHLWPREALYVDARALSFIGHHFQSAGHVIVDFLPRLRGFHQDPDLKIAVPAKMHRKHIELLSLFGISQDRIIYCALAEAYRFRELIVVDPGVAVQPSPDNVRFVAQYLRKSQLPRRKLRLFIDRGRPTRTIENRDQFVAELARLDFEMICLETMSISQQRDLIADAEIVVTTYGSDLLAYYFMAEGAHLIELTWDARLDAAAAPSCYFLGINYHHLPCDPTGEAANRKMKKDGDFAVDCATFRTMIANIVNA
jgi:capsular polysaccharide biosynthesis protein